ncbi:MAG: hypothetical protein IJW83_00115 [Clostridia bacterium]|nr:hypothetical protein [Clostridia bacterium]
MIFLAKRDGTILPYTPTAMTQGQIGPYEIVLLAPFPASTVVSVSFTLPNGNVTTPDLVPYAPTYAITDNSGNPVNVWKAEPEINLTDLSGKIKLQFFFTDATGTIPSTLAVINVGRGVTSLVPTVGSTDLQTIQRYLAAAQLAAISSQQTAAMGMAEAIGWATGQKYVASIDQDADALSMTLDETAFLNAIGYEEGSYTFEWQGLNGWVDTVTGDSVDLTVYGIYPGTANAFSVTVSMVEDIDPNAPWFHNNARWYAETAEVKCSYDEVNKIPSQFYLVSCIHG